MKGGCKLRGKAAEIRNFGPVLLELWKRHHNTDIELHTTILECLQGSVRMEQILDEHPRAFVLPGLYLLFGCSVWGMLV